MNLVELWGR